MSKNYSYGKTKYVFPLLKLNLSFIVWRFSEVGVIGH